MSIEERLKEYKQNKARLQVVWAQIRELEHEADEDYISGEVLRPRPTDLDRVQTSLSRTSSTERVVLNTQRINPETFAKIQKLWEEACTLTWEVEKMESAMGGLYERERFVVEMFFAEGLTWNTVRMRYEKEFQMPISDKGIRKIKHAAISKLKVVLREVG